MLARLYGSGRGFINSSHALIGVLQGKEVPLPTNCFRRRWLQEGLFGHKNDFSALVRKTNAQLDFRKEALSLQSVTSLQDLCNKVESGELTPKEAHSHEAAHWLLHATEDYGSRIIGLAANFVAGIESDQDELDRYRGKQ